jgi:hypothetical protein
LNIVHVRIRSTALAFRDCQPKKGTNIVATSEKIHVGSGVLKPGTRPIEVFVDKTGGYWLCDAEL